MKFSEQYKKSSNWIKKHVHESNYVIIRVLGHIMATPGLIIISIFCLIFTILRTFLCTSAEEIVWLWNAYIDLFKSLWKDTKEN